MLTLILKYASQSLNTVNVLLNALNEYSINIRSTCPKHRHERARLKERSSSLKSECYILSACRCGTTSYMRIPNKAMSFFVCPTSHLDSSCEPASGRMMKEDGSSGQVVYVRMKVSRFTKMPAATREPGRLVIQSVGSGRFLFL